MRTLRRTLNGDWSTLAPPIPTLTKVSTFRYNGGTQVDEDCDSDDMLVMMYAALLPSMKKLYGSNLVFQQISDQWAKDSTLGPWLRGMSSSTVTEIDVSFRGRDERAACLRFLRGFKDLESFKCSSGHFGGIASIKQALLASSRSSLRVLELHTLDPQDPLYLGPLNEFCELEKISINYMMLIDKNVVAHPLTKMLPTSVKELHLRDVEWRYVMCHRLAEKLFEGISLVKPWMFPELELVSSTSLFPKKVKQGCKTAGISTVHDHLHRALRIREWGSHWHPCHDSNGQYDEEDLIGSPEGTQNAETLEILFRNYHLGSQVSHDP